MLVLSRKVREEIVFPDLGITVKFLSLKGRTMRVGIEAPHDVRIRRGELADHGGQGVPAGETNTGTSTHDAVQTEAADTQAASEVDEVNG